MNPRKSNGIICFPFNNAPLFESRPSAFYSFTWCALCAWAHPTIQCSSRRRRRRRRLLIDWHECVTRVRHTILFVNKKINILITRKGKENMNNIPPHGPYSNLIENGFLFVRLSATFDYSIDCYFVIIHQYWLIELYWHCALRWIDRNCNWCMVYSVLSKKLYSIIGTHAVQDEGKLQIVVFWHRVKVHLFSACGERKLAHRMHQQN